MSSIATYCAPNFSVNVIFRLSGVMPEVLAFCTASVSVSAALIAPLRRLTVVVKGRANRTDDGKPNLETVLESIRDWVYGARLVPKFVSFSPGYSSFTDRLRAPASSWPKLHTQMERGQQ